VGRSKAARKFIDNPLTKLATSLVRPYVLCAADLVQSGLKILGRSATRDGNLRAHRRNWSSAALCLASRRGRVS